MEIGFVKMDDIFLRNSRKDIVSVFQENVKHHNILIVIGKPLEIEVRFLEIEVVVFLEIYHDNINLAVTMGTEGDVFQKTVMDLKEKLFIQIVEDF